MDEKKTKADEAVEMAGSFTVEWEQFFEACRKLVEYLEWDEQAHYESIPPEERAGHIYESIKVVKEWTERPEHD